MDENAKNKKSKPEESSLGTAERKKKKKKHKEIKKQHGNDKTFDPNENVDGNCIDEAGEIQVCSIVEKLTSDREEEGGTSKRKKKKVAGKSGVINSEIAEDKLTEIAGKSQKSKMERRKSHDDLLAGMQELGGSKRSKKVKMAVEIDFKEEDGGRISIEGANPHSLVNKIDDQGKMEKKKKKKVGGKSQSVEDYDSSAVNHSNVAEERQGKEMEKVLSKKKKRNEDGYRTNEGDDDDQCKKMKKKTKLSDKSKCKEKNESKSNEGNQHMAEGKKINKKQNDERCKDKMETKCNEGDQHLAEGIDGEYDDQAKKKKKRKDDKSHNKERDEVDDQGKKKTKAGSGGKSKPKPKGKRVTFSEEVEVCCDGLIRGKRFTPEEDEKIKEAVFAYIESHGLGDEGLDMVLHCRSHREVKHCWKEIGLAFPNRPYTAVYTRAHILFERSEARKWTREELDFVLKVKEQHGSDWKSIAEALGKNRFHVKDAWRRIRFTQRKKGPWTQEEYQQLFNLVNQDLRARSLEETRKRKHGMLRDNIPWEAIGTKFGSRTSTCCCLKWYHQLTSPLVQQGTWSDTDDYRLIDALYTLDACSMEEVDWDCLIESRDGDVCRKRWDQMVQHIGEHGSKSFAEQVEILAKRYCPDLVEAREAFDSKPVVC